MRHSCRRSRPCALPLTYMRSSRPTASRSGLHDLRGLKSFRALGLSEFHPLRSNSRNSLILQWEKTMLKGIDPLLGPELLAMLRAMGHADEICIADANFPSSSNARRLVRADGVLATDLVRAIASVMPIDDFI